MMAMPLQDATRAFLGPQDAAYLASPCGACGVDMGHRSLGVAATGLCGPCFDAKEEALTLAQLSEYHNEKKETTGGVSDPAEPLPTPGEAPPAPSGAPRVLKLATCPACSRRVTVLDGKFSVHVNGNAQVCKRSGSVARQTNPIRGV